jgi:pyridoxal phosphate enzyme (YggS family)
MVTEIARNLTMIRRRVEAAARRAGREPESVTLIGVSKTVPVERIREVAEAGLVDLGENRVQEAREKIPLLPETIRWHLVGHLQGNKARPAVELFRVVHSVDSVGILRRLERAGGDSGRSIDALVQVELGGEKTKFGAGEEELDGILEAAGSCRSVRVKGLMILPPYEEDPEKMRPYFRRLRALRDAAGGRHPELALGELSMGMSEDFEVAIEEGATMVRVGRALFGERPKP